MKYNEPPCRLRTSEPLRYRRRPEPGSTCLCGPWTRRKLRDSLLADAQEVCRFIEDLHPWTSFPFSEEVDIQQHHIAMFNKCINYTHDFDCPVRKRKHEALHNIALNWTGQFRKKGLHVYARWGQQPQDMRQRLIDAEWSMRTKLWLGYLFYSMLNMVII